MILSELMLMIVLPRGITGFGSYREAPLPVISEQVFRACCHTAAQQSGGEVVSHDSAAQQLARSFSVTTIQLPHQTVAVLVNAHCPMVAMAQPIAEGAQNIEFVDVPTLADAFRYVEGCEVLAASKLAQPVTDEALVELAASELDQVRYWKPTTIGQVIFNFWD